MSEKFPDLTLDDVGAPEVLEFLDTLRVPHGSDAHQEDVYEHSVAMYHLLGSLDEIIPHWGIVQFAALVHDCGKIVTHKIGEEHVLHEQQSTVIVLDSLSVVFTSFGNLESLSNFIDSILITLQHSSVWRCMEEALRDGHLDKETLLALSEPPAIATDSIFYQNQRLYLRMLLLFYFADIACVSTDPYPVGSTNWRIHHALRCAGVPTAHGEMNVYHDVQGLDVEMWCRLVPLFADGIVKKVLSDSA